MKEEHLTVAVGMSGGIDSSVAAALLLKEGCTVVGITMQIWDGSVPLKDQGLSACYGPGEERDLEAAQAHARRLGIPHHVIPLSAEFQREVLDYFRGEYRAGRTPNPCVRCNAAMKFGLLLDRARKAGLRFDRFATGHYARTRFDESRRRFLLLKGTDAAKDQSYFLARLSQEQLGSVRFPLGDMTKDDVRKVAADNGWTDLVDKPESQNFIEDKDYSALFESDPGGPGPILDLDGHRVGQHRGIVHYTVGQRKGLGMPGQKEPVFVIRIDPRRNAVIVGPRDGLMQTALTATDLNWIALERAPESPLRVKARIRQQHTEAWARLEPAQGTSVPAVRVVFDEPQLAITPGQAVVFYEDDIVLGSGIIV